MSKDTLKTQKEAPQRKRERQPLNRSRTLLDVRGKEPGWHYAWINEDKVDAAIAADYEFVRHPVEVGYQRIDVSQMGLDSQIWKNVGKGVKAFLMRQPEEFYQEDQALEQEKADEQMRARLGEVHSGGLSDINVSTSLGKK